MRLLAAIAALWAGAVSSDPILLQSTTSTQGSGLYDHILPTFTDTTGIEVQVLAVGTGQAIRNAQNCDADILLVHATAAELAFVDAGYGTARYDLMYNDFVIVGPPEDPAQISMAATVTEAFERIATSEARFASRGDDSGTHKAENRIWENAGGPREPRDDRWYLETGSGMGATLNVAVGLQAYTMTDRATWLRFANKNTFQVLFENDPDLFNQYGIVTLNPDHCPNVNVADSMVFADWLLGPDGQAAIASYEVAGQQLFFPNANP